MSIRSVQKWGIDIPTIEGVQTMTKCHSIRESVEGILSWVGMCVCVCVSHSVLSDSLWAQSRLPGFSVHGILQARILKWAAIPFSRGSSWPRDWSWVYCIACRFFIFWATRKWKKTRYLMLRNLTLFQYHLQ